MERTVHLGTAGAHRTINDGYRMAMLITYRRTGGLGALLALGGLAIAAGVLTAVVAAAVLLVGLAGAAAVLLVRAVLPRSWRRRKAPPATEWPHATIEGAVVNSRSGSRPE